VRSVARAAYPLPNIVFVENGDRAATARPGGAANGSSTLAISMGMPSMEPDVWRKDVRRAKERLGPGQMLIASVVGTPVPDSDVGALALDYAQCAAWATEAGADAIEVHLACPGLDSGRMLYEDLKASAHVLSRVRARVSRPIIAKLGAGRSPRLLHDTLTKLAPWVHGFELVDGILRRVLDAEGRPVFDGKGREIAQVVGTDTYGPCARQVDEAIAWRKAGEWHRAILAVGGVTSIERALSSLRDGADAVMVGTAALADPLLAFRFRSALQTAA
jgi:dihydroorotate dehydrogenase